MKTGRKLVDIAEAKSFIADNWPNDPLLRQIVLNLLEELPKVEVTEPAWIPVTERMPDMHIDEYEGSVFEVSDTVLGRDCECEFYVVAFTVDDLHRGWVDAGGCFYDITHWMPLPEPPKSDALQVLQNAQNSLRQLPLIPPETAKSTSG